jgi:sulfite exporter TauE/SafE
LRLVGVLRVLFLTVGLVLAAIGSLGVVYVVLKHPEAFRDFLVLAISILLIMMGVYIVSVASEEI